MSDSIENVLPAGATAKTVAESQESTKGIVRDYFETIVICVIFVIFARAFVFQQSKIPTGSMIPTLLVGDYIMVNKFIYAPSSGGLESSLLPLRDIRRGDIVVFKYPEEPEKDYIKRVIGLPGEFLEVRDNTVYINGVPLEEDYKVHANDMDDASWRKVTEGERPPPGEDLPPPRRSRAFNDDFKEVLIPEGHYFCMGDNRDNSKDSRNWGTVPRENIKGKAFIIWWSFRGEENNWVRTSPIDRVKSIADKVVHFFSKSRYGRCLRFIV
ncbi:MAG TPA: signal peptidase I [Candidatus Polarisedimenticolia bacterium]|nr:signal peptidase I [Candidatus Polarisedimenticolia bacterium]